MKKTISIFESNVHELCKRVEKFNNKLNKYDKDERVTYSIGEAYDYKCTLNGYTIVVRLVDVELDDVTVVLNTRHKIVARIEIVNMAGNSNTVVEIYDRKYQVEDFKDINKLNCDHCNSQRNRKKGFMIENLETGELMQVGSTCMKDYTQDLAIMDKLRFNNDILEDYSFDEDSYMKKMLSGADWLPIEEVIAYTNRIVKEDGKFISLKDAGMTGEKSTKEKVDKLIIEEKHITDEEFKEANEIIETIKECQIEEILDNDFNIQLLDMVKNRFCRYGKVSQAVWIYSLFNKIKNYKEKDITGGYVGEIGDKIELELQSIDNVWVETYYGNSCMNKFKDTEGNILVWWTTKEVNTEGQFQKMKFTIKDQKQFRDEFQTIITRAKVIK